MSERTALFQFRPLNDETPRRALVGAAWKRDVSPFPHHRNLILDHRGQHDGFCLTPRLEGVEPFAIRDLSVRDVVRLSNNPEPGDPVVVDELDDLAESAGNDAHLNLHAIGTVTTPSFYFQRPVSSV